MTVELRTGTLSIPAYPAAAGEVVTFAMVDIW